MSKNIPNFFDDFFSTITNYPIKKTQLAFGYGYDPNILKNGITEFEYSHDISPKIKLYTFSPRISYKIFPTLARLMRYKERMSNILIKGNTEIKNDYFTTDQDPNIVIQDLNNGLELIFTIYDPVPYEKTTQRRLTAKNIEEVMDYMVRSNLFHGHYEILKNENFSQIYDDRTLPLNECRRVLVDIGKIEIDEKKEVATKSLIQEQLDKIYSNIIVTTTTNELRFHIYIKKTKAEIKAEEEELKKELIKSITSNIKYKIFANDKKLGKNQNFDQLILGIIQDQISTNTWQSGSYVSAVDEKYKYLTDDIKKEIVIEVKNSLKTQIEHDIDKFLKLKYEKRLEEFTQSIFSENYNKIKSFTVKKLTEDWNVLLKEKDPFKLGFKYQEMEDVLRKAKRELDKNKFCFIEFNTNHTDLLYDHLDLNEKKEFLTLLNLSKEITPEPEWKLLEDKHHDKIRKSIVHLKQATDYFKGRYSEKLDKLIYDVALLSEWINLKYQKEEYQTIMRNVSNYNPTLLKKFELDLIDKTYELDLKARISSSKSSDYWIREAERKLKQLEITPNFNHLVWADLPKEVQTEIIKYLEIISRLFTKKGEEIFPKIEARFKSLKDDRRGELLERKKELIDHFTQLDNTSFQSIFLEEVNKKEKIEEYSKDYDNLIKLSKDLLTFENLKDPDKHKKDIYFIEQLIKNLEEKLSNRIINCTISKPIQQALYYFTRFVSSFSKNLIILIKKNIIRFIGRSKVMVSYMDFKFPITTDSIKIFKEQEITFNCRDFWNFTNSPLFQKVNYDFSLVIFDSYAKIIQTRPNFPLIHKKLDSKKVKKDTDSISVVIDKMESFSYDNYLKIYPKQLQLFYKDFSKSKMGRTLTDKNDYEVELKSLPNGILLVKKSKNANYLNKKLLDFSEFKEQKITNAFTLLFPIDYFISTFGSDDSIIKLLKKSETLTLLCESENPLKINLETKIDKDSSISLNYFLSPKKIKITTEKYQKLLLESLNSYDHIKADLNKIVKTTLFKNSELLSQKNVLEQLIKNNLQDYVIYNQKNKEYTITAETLSYLEELTSLEIEKEIANVQDILILINYFKSFKKYFNYYEKMVIICDYKNYNEKGKKLIEKQIKDSERKMQSMNKKIVTLKNNHKIKHNLEKKTIKELKTLAKTKDLKILSKFRKDEIIDKITDSYDDVEKQRDERNKLSTSIYGLNSTLKSYDRLPEYKRKIQSFIKNKGIGWYSKPEISDLLSLIGIGSKKELLDPYYNFILLRIKVDSSNNLQNKKQIESNLIEIDKLFQEVGGLWRYSDEDKITPCLNKMITITKKLETIDKKLVSNIIKGIKKYKNKK